MRQARRAATGLRGLKGEYLASPCSGLAFCCASGGSVRSVGCLSLVRPPSRTSPRELRWVGAAKAVRSAVGRPWERLKDCSFVLGPPFSRFLQARSDPEASGPVSARGNDGAGLRASEPPSLRPAHLSSDLGRGGLHLPLNIPSLPGVLVTRSVKWGGGEGVSAQDLARGRPGQTVAKAGRYSPGPRGRLRPPSLPLLSSARAPRTGSSSAPCLSLPPQVCGRYSWSDRALCSVFTFRNKQ